MHQSGSRYQWECRSCRYQFGVTAGTIMHRSHVPQRKWFVAIYLMCESKKGMSANQLERSLGVQYRTAWHLCQRIREAMGNDSFTGPTLFGVVEVDETVVDGKVKRRAGDTRATRLGWPERSSGAVRSASSVSRTCGSTPCKASSSAAVSENAEAVHTDELASQMGIQTETRRHEMVNHGTEEWVVGDAHVNSVESVWSLFKRSIMGAFPQGLRKARRALTRRARIAAQQPAQCHRSRPTSAVLQTWSIVPLSDSIPPEIGNLTNLQRLRLHDNLLTSGLPPELGNLASLERPWVEQNQSTGETPHRVVDL